MDFIEYHAWKKQRCFLLRLYGNHLDFLAQIKTPGCNDFKANTLKQQPYYLSGPKRCVDGPFSLPRRPHPQVPHFQNVTEPGEDQKRDELDVGHHDSDRASLSQDPVAFLQDEKGVWKCSRESSMLISSATPSKATPCGNPKPGLGDTLG
jgi:hypothetical protein